MSSAATNSALSNVSAALVEVLAQFAAAFKQTDRLLRLHTALGRDVLLPETFKAIEAISGAAQSDSGDVLAQIPITGYLLQIDALSTNAHLELKALIGQPILLELLTDQSRTQLRPFHGYVTAAECTGSNGGMARYRLTVKPWLAFLGAGRDSAVFQDQNVLQIVESIFTDYQGSLKGAGQLAPLWRLDVQDTSVYPIRSLTTQYQESDLQFVERLLLEEGLFMWFEHTGDAASPTLGSHTLVIADHNGAFKPNARSSIRFSQSKGTIEDDTIDQWRAQRQWHTHAVELASWDYRSLSSRNVGEHSGNAGGDGSQGASASASAYAHVPAGVPQLISQDTPGAYAYESTSQGQRLATQQLQALSVPGHSLTACGTTRTLAPGSTFTLSGHASASLASAPHVVLRVLHHAVNNLSAQLNGHAQKLAKSASSAVDVGASSYGINSIVKAATEQVTGSNASDTLNNIFYRNAALVLPLSVPYRGAGTDSHGQLIHPKPSVSGSQTALVIGVAGQHLTTDRDHRVKVQFAWQRGASSQSRLAHPAASGHSGAPAEDGTSQTTGTWVRVATPLAPIAGANWGSVALPRIGQEVLVTFLGGDIDRPVITGSLYNGKGQDNQQSNQVAAGAANATGNAPSWFPGDQQASGKQGKLPGHAHTAVLSGIKTQGLSTSQSGQGSYNQFIFDDTPGQSRLGLQSHNQQQGGTTSGGNHSGSHELNLGALRQQTDNQRLGSIGYGFELKTHFSGAIRSGSGMLLTADKRQGNESGASSHQMDSKEAKSQLQTGQDLVKALTETAQQHKAMLPVLKTSEVKPEKLLAFTQLEQNGQTLLAKAEGRAGEYVADSPTDNDLREDCSWLTEYSSKVPRLSNEDSGKIERSKRPYILKPTGSTKWYKSHKVDVLYNGYLVSFTDNTCELIYHPVSGGEFSSDKMYNLYSVTQLADAISQLSQLQLKTVEAFYLTTEVRDLVLAHYNSTDNCITVYPKDGLINEKWAHESIVEKIYENLIHECGHGLDDRWISLGDLLREKESLKDLEESLVRSNTGKQRAILQDKFLAMMKSAKTKADFHIGEKKIQVESSLLDKSDEALRAKLKEYKTAQKARLDEGKARHDDWKKAIKDDNWWVSEYAQKGAKLPDEPDFKSDIVAEDFAEHYAAYYTAIATPCEALMRKLMPNRAKFLDRCMNKESLANKRPVFKLPPAREKAIDNTRVHRRNWKLDTKANGPSDVMSSQRNWESWRRDNKGKGPNGEIIESHDLDESSGQSSGGAGETIAYNEPLIAVSAPAGIAFLTPQSASFNAGNTTSVAAGQDINLLAQANAGYSVKMGISLFTYGKPSNPKKPNQEASISLHAASGKVSSQSQSDKTQVTADKAITVASTTAAIQIQAPKHVLLTAQGAYIKMSGGNIEVHAPGKVDFLAAMKSWTSANSDSNSLSLPKVGKLKLCEFRAAAAATNGESIVTL